MVDSAASRRSAYRCAPMHPLLVILDLDETLIHAADEPLARAPDFVVHGYSVYKRPHLDAFLAALLERYRVAIWTAASRFHAEPILARLLPDLARLEFL